MAMAIGFMVCYFVNELSTAYGLYIDSRTILVFQRYPITKTISRSRLPASPTGNHHLWCVPYFDVLGAYSIIPLVWELVPTMPFRIPGYCLTYGASEAIYLLLGVYLFTLFKQFQRTTTTTMQCTVQRRTAFPTRLEMLQMQL